MKGAHALLIKSWAQLSAPLCTFSIGFCSLVQLVLEVMGHLEGAYALLVKSRHYPGELVACKRGSPLILGLRFADADGDDW